MSSAPTVDERLKARLKPYGRRPVMRQDWQNLLFAHWEFDPDLIQSTLPNGLNVDVHEGKAYLGVVPFFMRRVRPTYLPSLPWISNFLELNLRTYVYDKYRRPGVWFYSLDANQPIAVKLARMLFKLPYFDAKMSAVSGDGISFQSHRKGSEHKTDCSFFYKAASEMGESSPESLEFFLAERYLLFTADPARGSLYLGQVHHPPYQLYSASAEVSAEGLLELNGFTASGRSPDHLLTSPGVSVQIFAPERIC